MRLFQDLSEAHSEIGRDIFKSPLIFSSRVQNKEIASEVRECMGYSYAVEDIPTEPEVAVELACTLGLVLEDDKLRMKMWVEEEAQARSAWDPRIITEVYNPSLETIAFEGSEPSYTYTDRLRGAVEVMATALLQNPDTRRAFWPIFTPEDGVRATRQTRIPCSLGYWLAIRNLAGVPHLHLHYLQRSCDFKRFWFWDIYFARLFQINVQESLYLKGLDYIKLGITSHTILSLHMFMEEGEEVY